MKFKQLILLGLPGAGAPVQAKALAERWHVPHVSMGQLVDDAIAKASAIGLEIKPYVDADELIPDALALKLLKRRFEQPDVMLQGWVLAGFPRTQAQAQGLNEWLSAVGQPVAAVAYLRATTGLLINRLSADENPEPTPAIRRRLARHQEEIQPLLDYYQQQEQLTTVNASLSADENPEPAPAIRRRLARHQKEIQPLLDYYQQQGQLTTVNASLSAAEVTQSLAELFREETGAARFIQDESELDSLLSKEPLLVVDCMASWCGSCKLVTPLIDQLADAYKDRVNVMKIDFDANKQLPKRFGLKGMPAVMFFKDGELQETLTGVKPYQAYTATLTRFLE